MRNPFVYMKNVLVNSIKMIRHHGKLKMGMIQSFDHLHCEIQADGSISMGSCCQNRGNLYLVSGGEMKIGSHCFFNTGCSVTCEGSIQIGDNCSFGNNVVIVDHDHNYRHIGSELFISKPIVIGNNVWVGANVVILKNTVIGDNCVIAAGTTVRGTIPSGCIYYGEGEIKKWEN